MQLMVGLLRLQLRRGSRRAVLDELRLVDTRTVGVDR